MAITFVNKGTWAAGTTSISPGIPASMQAGDFMILDVHTPNQAVTTPSGWTVMTTSPVSTGTAGAAGGTRISSYYRWWQSGDAAPTVAVTGGLVTNGIISGYRGVHPTTPLDATPVATTLATASTTLSMGSITTATANALIHWSVARDQDLNSTTAVTAFTNANLTGITEIHDQVVNTSVGGGIWNGYGFKATAGAIGTTTITQTSSIAVGLTIALRPQPNAYTLTAQGGSYSVTGQSATILKSEYLVASGGSYTLTGQQAVITWAAGLNAYTLTAQGGSYSLIGSSANLARNRNLTASGGSYALTGGSATLLRTKRLTANGGSYTVTGGTAALLRSKQLVASGGSYTVTGGAALLSRNRTLTAQGGVYTYTGQQVNITYVPVSVGYTLTAQGGSYTLTGAGVTIQRSKQLYASGGSYNLTGGSANISRNRKLTASGGAYTYVGSSAVLMHVTPYPDPGYVLLGITYGPGGIYVGTLDALDKSVKFDITTGALVKPINNKVVMSL